MTKKKMNPVAAYLQSAFSEWGKITWPTREQAVLLTAITLVSSSIVVLLVTGVDAGFSELYQWLLDLL